VIRGETTHYETVCEESARGITLLGVQHGLCIGNGILTCETVAQAEDRADPARQDKGGGAATAALHLVAIARRFGRGPAGGSPPEGTEVLMAGAALSRTA
jgi:6,7-dimethyl-8-ribityllumazine synthase